MNYIQIQIFCVAIDFCKTNATQLKADKKIKVMSLAPIPLDDQTMPC